MSYRIGYLGDGGIKVEIISYEKHPAKIAFDMLKQTWRNLHDVEYDPENQLCVDFIVDSLEGRLNPTPFENIRMQVVFKGISRVNLAQLTRQRNWLFNSESQMPQAVKHDVIMPINIANSEFYEEAIELIKKSQDLYDRMTTGNKETMKIPFQDARYLLLHGQTADISASFTMPLLVNACNQRLENNTHDEINYTFRVLIHELKGTILLDPELDKLDRYIYRTFLNRCDAFGANQKKGFCCDAMFGNSFKRFPDA